MDQNCSQQQQQRVVIFAGPHKAASTSVESFMARYAHKLCTECCKDNAVDAADRGDGQDEAAAAAAAAAAASCCIPWTWPYVSKPKRGKKVSKDRAKQFAYYLWGLISEPEMRQAIRAATKVPVGKDKNHNVQSHLVLGAELLDERKTYKFFTNNWQKVLRVLPTTTTTGSITAVVNYRVPRVSHLLSIWNQEVRRAKRKIRRINDLNFTAPKEFLFWDWICANQIVDVYESSVRAVLASRGNPLGLAYDIHQHVNSHLNVVVVDMGGVEKDRMDVPEVIACEVLSAKQCQNGTVVFDGDGSGNKATKSYRSNKSIREAPDVTDEQMEQIEAILRRFDCQYKDLDATFLHRDTALESCKDNNDSIDDWTTYALLRELGGCEAREQHDNERLSFDRRNPVGDELNRVAPTILVFPSLLGTVILLAGYFVFMKRRCYSGKP